MKTQHRYFLQGWWRLPYHLFAWLPLVVNVMLFYVLWVVSKGLSVTQLKDLLKDPQTQQTLFLLGVLVVLAFFMLWFSYHLLGMSWLELGAKGIYYQQPGLLLFAKWEDISAYDKRPYGRFRVLSLIPEHVEIKSRGLLAFLAKRVMGGRYTIPLTPFSTNWYYSDLKKDLEHYLPELEV